LTFSATSLNKARSLRLGFVERIPFRPLADPRRCLLLKPGIGEILDGTDVHTGFPHIEADKVVGRYVAGHLIFVTRKSAEDVDLEQLEDLDDVWALCFRKPRPGYRLLGRFLEQDTFVGFRLYDRHTLDGEEVYAAKAAEIIDDWKADFGSIEPLRSKDLAAYLSGDLYRDVDQED
jgi:hypothetical protein